MVKTEMASLQRMGGGNLKTVDRSMFFFKNVPDTVNLAVLETLHITRQQYTKIFLQKNTGLTILQQQAALENHPNGDDFKRYMSSITAELVELAD